MKLIYIFFILISFPIWISISSCQEAFLVPEPVLIPDTVSFETHLMPIFDESCNMSGCHNTGGIAPDLTLANAYDQLFLYGYVNTDEPENSSLYQRMINQAKPMPPSAILSESKTQLVLSWIKQGGLNN